MDEEQVKSILKSPNADIVLDGAAVLTNVVPYVGGVVAAVLSSYTLGRKIKRVNEVLYRLAHDLQTQKDHVNETYVKSEEFEDILERTLKQLAEERNAEKRDLYAKFLLSMITAPDPQYDDEEAFLRLLGELQFAEVNVLHVLHRSQEGWASLLASRYLDIPPEKVQEHLDALLRSGLITYTPDRVDTRMNQITYGADQAIEYVYKVSPAGRRFLQFLGVTEYM
jgi:DNA-binding transcriptional ArsR family regulator